MVERTGRSARSISRAVSIGNKLAADVIQSLAGLPDIASNASELKALSRLDHEMQRAVVATIQAGDRGADGRPVRTVREALAYPPGPAEDVPATTQQADESQEQVTNSLKLMVNAVKDSWCQLYWSAATAQLAAAALDELADEWSQQNWTVQADTKCRHRR